MTREARGNFVVWINKQKTPGDTLPNFTGRISVPAIRADHHTALWGHRDKHRRIYLSGIVHPLPIGTEASEELEFALEPPVYDIDDIVQASPHLTLKPNEIILFANVHRTADAPKLPEYYGRAIIGISRHLVEIGAWLKRSRSNTLMFSGATSFSMAKPAAATVAPTTELDDLIER